MEYKKFIDKDLITTEIKEKRKKKILKEFSRILGNNLSLSTSDIYSQLLEREDLDSTAVGNGIAIPHCRIQTDKFTIKLLVVVSKEGINFDSIDKKPVHLFFVIIAANNSQASYFKVLSHLARALQNQDFYNSIVNAKNIDEIYDLLMKTDEV